MKIFEETSTRLIIRHKPITKWIMGGCLFTIGSILLVNNTCFEVATARLICSRSSQSKVNCELRQYSTIGAITTVKLFDPKKAYVLTKTGRRGSKSYKTIIVTPNGEFSPLSHASYQQNSDFVNKVNNFITSGENNLSVQQHQREYLNFMSFIFFIMMVAGAYLFTSPKSNCSFYKNLGKLIIERQGLRGTETIEHSLDLILYMEIEQKKVKGGMVYRPVIVLKGLQKIPMMLEFTRQERHISDIVRRINLFLGLQDGY